MQNRKYFSDLTVSQGETDRQTDRQTDRDSDTERDRNTDKQRQGGAELGGGGGHIAKLRQKIKGVIFSLLGL